MAGWSAVSSPICSSRECCRVAAASLPFSTLVRRRSHRFSGKSLRNAMRAADLNAARASCSGLNRALEIALVDEAASVGSGLPLRTVLTAQFHHVLGASEIDLATDVKAFGICHQELIGLRGRIRRGLRY